MSGKIKEMIEKIATERSKGNETLKNTTYAKLCLKGVNPASYSSSSPDDPAVIEKLHQIANEMGVRL